MKQQKLQKFLANQGLGSRRAMERAITAGHVTVNTALAHLGQVVTPQDKIYYENKLVPWPETQTPPQLLIYNKPEGEICTRDDPEGRRTVFDNLPPHPRPWIIIGRLDVMTSGLLLFTDNGELANQYMHPRYQIEREYRVRIQGKLNSQQLASLTTGITLEDGPAKVKSIKPQPSQGDNTWYNVVLTEGRNREVRRLFAHLGFQVNRLLRIRYGNINLPEDLKRGQWLFYQENIDGLFRS